MPSQHKLSLSTAILVNLNIMLGKGLFINTALLAHLMGTAGSLAYLAVGILVTPIILTFAELMKQHPQGTIFDHANREFGYIAGFLVSFGYSIGKMGSAVLAIHVCNMIAELMIPELAIVNIMTRDIIVMLTFVGLNLLNLKMGARIQRFITILKAVPIALVIIGGMFVFSIKDFVTHAHPRALPDALSFALFAFAGFEATLAITPKLKNPRDGLKAVLISCALVIATLALYQAMFSGALGKNIIFAVDWLEAFKMFGTRLAGDTIWAVIIARVMAIGVAFSAFGSGYSILFSNGWNIYAVAKQNLLPFSRTFVKISKNNIPLFAVLLQGAIALTYIVLAKSSQIPMQQMAVLGVTCVYVVITLAFIKGTLRRGATLYTGIIGIGALIGSAIFLVTLVQNFLHSESRIAFYIYTAILGTLSTLAFFRGYTPLEHEEGQLELDALDPEEPTIHVE
ncbi:APC family permease [bacterium]|jgi:amino acid transporter|nr:APC family permease [bacterium]MBT3903717.1 APC family permease [bacterium]MBT4577670.1 APC family permease [bacterium]MBT5345636.1 APC family permease [bacterium]MBT6130677.1 APC family permease [bacterium]